MQLKSHFLYSRKQRNGILLLIALLIVVQCVYFIVDIPSDDVSLNAKEIESFQQEVDSLKLVAIEKRKPKIFSFNPNFITDYKGYTLGMTNEEIDRLLKFRLQDQWINSTRQFQEVTKVPDSLLAVISPYFKFPDWITNPKPNSISDKYPTTTRVKTFEQKIDLNKATATQLQKVNGIGVTLSNRILKYRSKFVDGFISDIQLQDIYGLSPEVIVKITNDFTVKTPRHIQKINLNTATRDQLVTIQHIDYEIAHYILEYRTLVEGFKSLDELAKVKSFPLPKIEIIKLYLTLD